MTDDFDKDLFFNLPHGSLAWSILRVSVRKIGDHWEQAHEFQLSITGMGTPFMGRYPSRESAGRNGMAMLAEALRRVDREDGPKAQELSAMIRETFNPSQLCLAL